jgi:uncharacterized protein YkwD
MTGRGRLWRAFAAPLSLAIAISITGAAGPAIAGDRAHRFQIEMLRLVNQTRVSHGLQIVDLNRNLSLEALQHSEAMGQRFSLFHTPNVWTLVQPFGAHAWGENIAYAATLQRVEQLWLQSYEHRVNLLDPAFHYAAIGVVKIRGWLWVTLQLYG